nr:F420-dependent NADP oxidoreductase [uncultured Flavobacterium sp.]
MVSVIIIGSGNVAQHLIRAFLATDNLDIVQAYARQPQKLHHLLPSEKVTNDITTLAHADVYIISVSDNAIADVAATLPFNDRLVVHTSGSTGMEVLGTNNRNGVFYPLQTFSAAKAVDFKEVPLCIETANIDDMPVLENLANALSEKVYHISGKQRQALHVAAVFSCNFVNHLYGIGARVCEENNIPFDILKPLIIETADKIKTLSPTQAQTGPAVRNDTKTIERHLDFIQDDKLKKLYTLLTNSIQETHEQKL